MLFISLEVKWEEFIQTALQESVANNVIKLLRNLV